MIRRTNVSIEHHTIKHFFTHTVLASNIMINSFIMMNLGNIDRFDQKFLFLPFRKHSNLPRYLEYLNSENIELTESHCKMFH